MTEKISPFPFPFLSIRRVVLVYLLDMKTLALPARGGSRQGRASEGGQSERRAWLAGVSYGDRWALPGLPMWLQGRKELSDGSPLLPREPGLPPFQFYFLV